MCAEVQLCASLQIEDWLLRLHKGIGPLLLAEVGDGSIRVFDISRGSLATENVIKLQAVPEGLKDGFRKITSANWVPDNPNLITSCDSEGLIQFWDLRTCSAGIAWNATRENRAGVAFNGQVCALGDCRGSILLWDPRVSKQIALLEEIHTDEISQITFHDVYRTQLLSAAADGLVQRFDLNAPSEDDCLQSVWNTEQTARRIGFFGSNSEFLYSLTEVESVLLYDMTCDDAMGSFDRSYLKQDDADFVSCSWKNSSKELGLFVANSEGCILRFSASPSHLVFHSRFDSGHNQSVRDVIALDESTIASCGEDARLCIWKLGALGVPGA